MRVHLIFDELIQKIKKSLNANQGFKNRVAGVAGIEPASREFRVRCLTAWLHPNIHVTEPELNELR